MARKKPKSHSVNKSVDQSSSKKDAKPERTGNSWFGFVVRNILAGLVAFGVGYGIYKSNVGYTWVFDTLLKGNLETIEKYPDLTYEQKMEAKINFLGTYAFYLKNNTPDSAIILMPPDSVINAMDTQYKDYKKVQWIRHKSKVSYLVQPRKVVYADHPADSAVRDNYTHVAIMGKWGYEQAGFPETPMSQRQDFSVIQKKS